MPSSTLPLFSFPDEIIESIVDCATQDTLVELGKTCSSFRSLIPSCELPILRLLLFPSGLHIAADSIDCQMAKHFFAPHNHSLNTWKKKTAAESKVNCYRRFAFPPTEKYSLFASARIEHLEIDRFLPVYLDDDNLHHLTTLLSGCYVKKVTIIIDKKTLDNVLNVPAFLTSIHAKHVEFVLQNPKSHDMLAPFLTDEFATALAKTEVREVTLTGDPVTGRIQAARSVSRDHPRNGRGKPSFAFDVLLNLAKAGIFKVNVNPYALENDSESVTSQEMRAFIDKLPENSSLLKLQMKIDIDTKNVKHKGFAIEIKKKEKIVLVTKLQ